MTTETYRDALKQAKTDLAEQVAILGKAQEATEKAEKTIVELRQTIASLQRLCGEPEYVEEDALGLTDAIRMAFKTQDNSGNGMSAQDVRTKLESMGYSGRWGNVLASIHTVIKRLHEKKEIEASGNLNGRETYRWAGRRRIVTSSALTNHSSSAPRNPLPGSPGITLRTQDDIAYEQEKKRK